MSYLYCSSCVFYFPVSQKIDVHIKSRIFSFILAILLYIFYIIITKEISIKPHKTSFKKFGKGTLIGLLVVIAHTVIAVISGSIKFTQYNIKWKFSLYVIGIYFFGMLLTAFTEELVMRGVVQETLDKYFNTNYVIIFIAILFGWWHLSAELLYAIGAFVTGDSMGAFVYALDSTLVKTFLKVYLIPKKSFNIKILNHY